MKFFPEAIRAVDLIHIIVKKNAQDERRLRLDFSMLLTNKSLVKAHDSIAKAYDYLKEEESAAGEIKILNKVQTQVIEFYATDKARQADIKVGAAELRQLVVSRPDAEKKAENIYLTFTTTVPATKGLLNWAFDNLGATVFAKFVDAQMALITEDDKDDMPELPLENQEAIEEEDRERGT